MEEGKRVKELKGGGGLLYCMAFERLGHWVDTGYIQPSGAPRWLYESEFFHVLLLFASPLLCVRVSILRGRGVPSPVSYWLTSGVMQSASRGPATAGVGGTLGEVTGILLARFWYFGMTGWSSYTDTGLLCVWTLDSVQASALMWNMGEASFVFPMTFHILERFEARLYSLLSV